MDFLKNRNDFTYSLYAKSIAIVGRKFIKINVRIDDLEIQNKTSKLKFNV